MIKKFLFLLFAVVGIFSTTESVFAAVRSYPFIVNPAQGVVQKVNYEQLAGMASTTRISWLAPNHATDIASKIDRYEVRISCFSCVSRNTWSQYTTYSVTNTYLDFNVRMYLASLSINPGSFQLQDNNLVRFQVRAVYNASYRPATRAVSSWSPSAFFQYHSLVVSSSIDTVLPAVSMVVSSPVIYWSGDAQQYTNNFSFTMNASDAGGLRRLSYYISTSSSDIVGSLLRGSKLCYGNTSCSDTGSSIFFSRPLYGQTLYFRASAIDMASNTAMSAPVAVRFERAVTPATTTPPSLVLRATPAITAPVLNQIFSTYPRTAELRWNPVVSATQYQVELACDVCVSTRTLYMAPYYFTVAGTVTTTRAFAGDNMYRMRVRSQFADGLFSRWSVETYFRFKTR